MSFSHQIKSELLENRSLQRYRWHQAYGLFLFSRRFDRDEISISTENLEVRGLYIRHIKTALGKKAEIAESVRSGKTAYTAFLAGSREELLSRFEGGILNRERLTTAGEAGAFLSGAYLACGSMSDPKKSYHLEFVTRKEELCRELTFLLEGLVPGIKNTLRRGSYINYYKECSQIEDLLTLMGASKSSLALIDVEIIKGVRNRANRVTNCETANIDKTVNAASSQVEDIRLILAEKGLEYLPENLRETAVLRLDNPDLSLRELCQLMSEPVSRSGVHHRLERLTKIAADIRGEK